MRHARRDRGSVDRRRCIEADMLRAGKVDHSATTMLGSGFPQCNLDRGTSCHETEAKRTPGSPGQRRVQRADLVAYASTELC